MSRLGLFLIAFALATGSFWLTVLTDPPKSEASVAAPPKLSFAVEAPNLLKKPRFVPEELCGRFGDCD